MTEKQIEAYNAVKKINEELAEKYLRKDKKDDYKDWISLQPSLTFVVNEYRLFISLSIPSTSRLALPEITLYNSLEDDRIYYEKSDKYETFYKFLKRKFIEVKEEIYAIKL